jgi:hypothetical protein
MELAFQALSSGHLTLVCVSWTHPLLCLSSACFQLTDEKSDDYTWTAHKALTGISDLGSELSLKEASTQQPLVDTINSFFGADCYRFPEDVDLGNPLVSTCAKGYTKVGYDDNGCTSLGVSI